MERLFRNNFNEAVDILKEFISDEKNWEKLEKAGQLMLESILSGGKIISCGNGGSAETSHHPFHLPAFCLPVAS